MKRLLTVAAVLEAATGLALLLAPSFVARLLLGDSVSGTGTAVGRVAGCALVSLGIACWPSRNAASRRSAALTAMLTYNLLVSCYLMLLGLGGQRVGVLLWPAVAIHGLLALLLVRAGAKAVQAQHE
jgi:hypothetical protein